MGIRFDPTNRVHRLYYAVYGRQHFSLDFYRCWFVGLPA